MRAHAAAGGRMPPMLHVAFAELMRGGAQEMLAGEGRLGMHQRHHILQLVAEAERSAGLVEPGASPQAAAQGLIQQPAVGHHVNGGIGGFDLHGAERSIPILPDAFEGATAGLGGAEAADQGLHFSRRSAPPRGGSWFPVPARRANQESLAPRRKDPTPLRSFLKAASA